MLRRWALLAAVGAVAAVGCSAGDRDGGVDRAGEAELIAADYGVPVETGRCVVDQVVDAMGEDRYEVVAGGEEAPTAAEVGLLFDALGSCGVPVDRLFDDAAVADIAASFGLEDAEARCVVNLAVERLGAARLAELGSLGSGPEGVEADALLAIVDECTG